ncbi:OB-fold domain-containing protein [Candidatus Dojkabacteria bacterium]|uniref:OB-fold domain-containing protein n=1 Tax=Candidatus Dojkabacteria bacterium TaxID=2099670 RepID=A0A955L887_9BACT|nr:OB-fold domain-containing protein [Candidatus Dojkabacteria bacterium]
MVLLPSQERRKKLLFNLLKAQSFKPKTNMHKSSPSKIWRKFDTRYSIISNQKAKLISWSKVESGPDGFDLYTPYTVGILEFEDGTRFTAQVTDSDYDTLKYGDVFVPFFKKYYEDGSDGVIHYGLKWRKI